MYAVIKTGGKQYRVAADDVITIEKIAGEAGSKVEFAEVLMIGGDKPKIGSPLVSGAKSAAARIRAASAAIARTSSRSASRASSAPERQPEFRRN
jgi:ribosomal protein L21